MLKRKPARKPKVYKSLIATSYGLSRFVNRSDPLPEKQRGWEADLSRGTIYPVEVSYKRKRGLYGSVQVYRATLNDSGTEVIAERYPVRNHIFASYNDARRYMIDCAKSEVRYNNERARIGDARLAKVTAFPRRRGNNDVIRIPLRSSTKEKKARG